MHSVELDFFIYIKSLNIISLKLPSSKKEYQNKIPKITNIQSVIFRIKAIWLKILFEKKRKTTFSGKFENSFCKI